MVKVWLEVVLSDPFRPFKAQRINFRVFPSLNCKRIAASLDSKRKSVNVAEIRHTGQEGAENSKCFLTQNEQKTWPHLRETGALKNSRQASHFNCDSRFFHESIGPGVRRSSFTTTRSEFSIENVRLSRPGLSHGRPASRRSSSLSTIKSITVSRIFRGRRFHGLERDTVRFKN